MNQSIWKFPLVVENKTTLQMPVGSEVLCVQAQAGHLPCLWALVYPEKEKEDRHFELFGTGHPVPNDISIERKYIGTYQLEDGAFVAHLFERK